MCVFRFKLWWMTQRMGSCGQDIPFETQFLLVEGHEDGSHFGEDDDALYTVFLPILEGDFRAVLQGNSNNELEICLESGVSHIQLTTLFVYLSNFYLLLPGFLILLIMNELIAMLVD